MHRFALQTVPLNTRFHSGSLRQHLPLHYPQRWPHGSTGQALCENSRLVLCATHQVRETCNASVALRSRSISGHLLPTPAPLCLVPAALQQPCLPALPCSFPSFSAASTRAQLRSNQFPGPEPSVMMETMTDHHLPLSSSLTILSPPATVISLLLGDLVY